MSSKYNSKKLNKKQRRCEAIIQSELNIQASEEPTKFIAILNAGLSTGLTEELILQTAEKYAQVKKLLMIPNKSYCFLECLTNSEAQNLLDNMHGKAKIGQNDGVTYLSYFCQLPKVEDDKWLKPLPEGIILLQNFVSEQEEVELLKALHMNEIDCDDDAELKHRKVKHFGYEFLYGINNVNPEAPLDNKIPKECDILWSKLDNIKKERNYQFDWTEPDQLTVNSYQPGQGIPPHVDTHSAFLDPIMSLSLESDVVMEFRKGIERRSVLLPRRSLLIMSAESRYDWTHGITPKVLDVVLTSAGNLTTQHRKKRTSLTFRKLRRAPCNCHFPLLCDTKLEEKNNNQTLIETEKASMLEEANVHSVYDHIAEHFSETRHSPWPQVAEFLNSFPQGSILLDVGCGNGKYLNTNNSLLNIGCDRSSGLLKVCNSLQYNVFRCDCLNVPIRSNCIDACISIAVIHHLASKERRLMAIQEMARILKPKGQALIYVWAKNQSSQNKKSSYLRQNKSLNKNKSTEGQQRQQTQQQLQQKAKEAPVSLPVHTNRTEFLQQDVLVPWKVKPVSKILTENDEQVASTFLRYYHVFEQNELEQLIGQLENVHIIRSYYDQGNYCCIFEKL